MGVCGSLDVLCDFVTFHTSLASTPKFRALPRVAVSNKLHINLCFGQFSPVLSLGFSEIPAVYPAWAACMLACSFIRCTCLAKAYRHKYEYTQHAAYMSRVLTVDHVRRRTRRQLRHSCKSARVLPRNEFNGVLWRIW